MKTKQLRKYRVQLNLSKVFNSIKGFKLREFSRPYPTVSMTAKSPDDVCGIVKDNLLDLLKGQKGVNENILQNVAHKMSIKKIEDLDE